MRRLVIGAALMSLVGCAPTRYKPLCPPLVHYTPQEQKQAADELRTHPDLHELPIMMRDYGDEREEIGILPCH